jgi:hypothetical protein
VAHRQHLRRHRPAHPAGLRVAVDLRHGDLRRENLHLRRALTSRGVISVAKGNLMATAKVDEDRAFAMLVRASQRENVKLRDICDRILAGRHDPALETDVEPGVEAGVDPNGR